MGCCLKATLNIIPEVKASLEPNDISPLKEAGGEMLFDVNGVLLAVGAKTVLKATLTCVWRPHE